MDYETTAAAGRSSWGERGAGCSVVLTFARCGAYAAEQDADSTRLGGPKRFDEAQTVALAGRSSDQTTTSPRANR